MHHSMRRSGPVAAVLLALALVLASSPCRAQSVSSTTVGPDGSATLKNGRFTLVIPKGALRERATIRMAVGSGTATTITLDITPESANDFRIPLTLMADVKDAPPVASPTLGMLTFDPTVGKWKKVDGSRNDIVVKRVSAPLWHFSIYGVGDVVSGKAGW